MNPFEICTELSTSTTDNWGTFDEKDYLPFMVNRNFSYHMDTIMLANEVNNRGNMPVRWQYDFYRLAIQPKKKRFAKWAKPEEDANVKLVSEAFNVSNHKAIVINSLLNKTDFVAIKELMNCGGR